MKNPQNTPSGRWVGIRNISDYSPFGVLLKERTVESEFFRLGFNGMEGDDEVKGKGNSYDFGARMLDPRVGRWLSIDKAIQPERSTYSGMHNNPILLFDPNGNDVIVGTWKKKDIRKFVTHLQGITGLDVYVDKKTKTLQVRYDNPDFQRPEEYQDLAVSSIAAGKLLEAIDDHCLEMVVSGIRGEGSYTDASYRDGGEGEDPWSPYINVDPTESEMFIAGWEIRGQQQRKSQLTRDLAGTTGMKFFHEISHGMDGTLDEWAMGSPSPEAATLGDERSASGVMSGSATSFENAILNELGLLIRATYSIKVGDYKVIPYIRPERDADVILDGFKSAGTEAKFPQTTDYTKIKTSSSAEDDGDRDYKENPTPRF
jgi:RHS repeat-associated protein